MYSVNGTTITLTRGDTFRATITINSADGTKYTPSEGDSVRFAMKKNYSDATALLTKTIPTNTMVLSLAPTDTKTLDFDTYVYDIQLTKADGDVDTFLSGKLKITVEVD